jgi:hypothetical protein
MNREDVYCPACPDPDTAFRIEDVGMKFDSGEPNGDGMRFRATRPVWEPVMLEHLRLTDDAGHRRLYDQCVTHLMASGVTVEESARNSVQAATDSLRRMMDDALRSNQQKGTN